MQVVVLTKFVPNPQGVADLGEDFLVIREEVESGLDPTDEYGVEAALAIVEEHGGEVTLVTMGPEQAMAGLRRGLAMGAHRAVLITDPVLRGADVLVTARTLAAAIRKLTFDLIIGGTESTDGYTGTLPVEVAELLGLPSATFARKLSVAEGIVRVERNTETGYDVLECSLPALVTVTAGANEPRYPTMKGIMQAKQKPLQRFSTAELGLTGDQLTASQQVVDVQDAPLRAAGEVLQANEETAARIADFLAAAKVI